MATAKEQAAAVRAAYTAEVDRLYNDRSVEPDERAVRLSGLRLQLDTDLLALRRANDGEGADRREAILQRLSSAPAGVTAESYRAAITQAQAASGPALGKLLVAAGRVGDQALARACFAVALERGDQRVVATYAAGDPDVRVDLELLNGLRQSRHDRLADSAAFSAASVSR